MRKHPGTRSGGSSPQGGSDTAEDDVYPTAEPGSMQVSKYAWILDLLQFTVKYELCRVFIEGAELRVFHEKVRGITESIQKLLEPSSGKKLRWSEELGKKSVRTKGHSHPGSSDPRKSHDRAGLGFRVGSPDTLGWLWPTWGGGTLPQRLNLGPPPPAAHLWQLKKLLGWNVFKET